MESKVMIFQRTEEPARAKSHEALEDVAKNLFYAPQQSSKCLS